MHPEQLKSFNFKNMSAEKKLQLSLDLYYSARTLKEAGLRQQHPDWSESQIKQKKFFFMQARDLFKIFITRLNRLNVPYMITESRKTGQILFF